MMPHMTTCHLQLPILLVLRPPSDETPEKYERRMVELKEKLEKGESEIAMLRQGLGRKVRRAGELKRSLGISPFQEFKQEGPPTD